ncbi:MAG: M6 family metalloprotease domain-containing protein [Deltaproteobacteria bacterium]|nr:M6 family metalloprotease domain-containing protein [Deltaproteobacteria bacterium]
MHASSPFGIALLLLAAPAFAVPMPPVPVEAEDRDGHRLLVLPRGDEHLSWLEDLAGFTLAWDEAGGRWRYARAESDGRLVPTHLRAGHGDPRALGLLPHLRPSSDALRAADERRRRAAPRAFAPMKGVVRNLVLLVKFKNHSTKYQPADFEPVFNGATDSVRAYYDEVSGGTVQLTSTIEPWLELSQNDAHYAFNGAHPDGHPEEMVMEAIAALDAQRFDFKRFDQNDDGFIDAIDVIHTGKGYESTPNPDSIHSHFARLITPITTHDGVRIVAYHTEPELRGNGEITMIGGIVHETAHFFGLPDLYDTTFASSGLGLWCLMSSGAWGGPDLNGTKPTHLSAWAKARLGFVTPRTIATSVTHQVLQPVEEGGAVVRIEAGMPTSQYFLLENRRKVGSDLYLPGSGLLVFHIDERMADNNDSLHYLVDLEQADGLRTLNTSALDDGDAQDPFPNASHVSFTPETTPNSQPYGGKPTSKVYLTNIVREDAAIAFDFRLASALGTACQADLECGSNFCASQLCCDTACDGPCEACSEAAGADRDGHCAPFSNVSCDDHDLCSRRDICESGACVGHDPVTCAPTDECHAAGLCDPATGKCSWPPAPDGTPCSKGACLDGACQSPPADAGLVQPSPDAGSPTTPTQTKGCGCASGGSGPAAILGGLTLLATYRRRRRP